MKHVLWDCPSATYVWGACGRKVQKSTIKYTNFTGVKENLVERCTKEEVEFHVEITRRIWFRRNTVVHGGEFTHPNILVQTTSTFIANYREAMQKTGFRREYKNSGTCQMATTTHRGLQSQLGCCFGLQGGKNGNWNHCARLNRKVGCDR
jgi:hypothetical protein